MMVVKKITKVISLFLSLIVVVSTWGIAFAGDTLSDVKQKGVLVAGVKDSLPPFGYVDAKSRRIVGYEIDFINAIARKLGVMVELKPITSSTRIPQLQEGKIDIIAATFTKNSERAKLIDFSHAYFFTGQKFITKKGSVKSLEDLEGKKIGTAKGSTSEQNLKKAIPSSNVLLFDDYQPAFLALQQGKVTAITTDEAILVDILSKAPNKAQFEIPHIQITNDLYGLGIRKNDRNFLNFVNNTILELEQSGEARQIFEKWFGSQRQFPIARNFQINSQDSLPYADRKDSYPSKPSATHSEPSDNSLPSIRITSPEIKRGLKAVAKESAIIVTGNVTGGGIAEVMVNGQPASLDESGNFSASDVLLKVGDNRMTVTALGVNKQRAVETFTIAREIGVIAKANKLNNSKTTTIPLPKGKSYALIIGINSYRYIDKLKTATNDATAVSKILKEEYGFDTKIIIDTAATRTGIMKELNNLKNLVNPEDRLLIYYAGHGYNDPETETSYWLPVEAEKTDPTNWINAKDITDQLKRSRAKQVLVVADSCYSGTLSRALEPSLTGKGTRDSFIQKMMEKSSRVLIASGGNEPVSDSGGKNHSIFAQVFIDALKKTNEPVFTAEELLTQRIKEAVAGRADQTPEYKIIRNSGHDGGDFVFVRQ